jgi:hypothetical protein
MKMREQKSIAIVVNPDVINGAFKLASVIDEYQPLLSGDKHVSQLLQELSGLFKLAASGDLEAFDTLLKEGQERLSTVQNLLKHDAIEGQTEDNESAAFVAEYDRRSMDYFELRHNLMDFENEYFNKIQNVAV